MDRQLLLLGLLRREEMHGYQINEFIEEKMHFCIDLKKPTAYYILDKLAQQKYVAVEREQAGNRPPRRSYLWKLVTDWRCCSLQPPERWQQPRTKKPRDPFCSWRSRGT